MQHATLFHLFRTCRDTPAARNCPEMHHYVAGSPSDTVREDTGCTAKAAARREASCVQLCNCAADDQVLASGFLPVILLVDRDCPRLPPAMTKADAESSHERGDIRVSSRKNSWTVSWKQKMKSICSTKTKITADWDNWLLPSQCSWYVSLKEMALHKQGPTLEWTFKLFCLNTAMAAITFGSYMLYEHT